MAAGCCSRRFAGGDAPARRCNLEQFLEATTPVVTLSCSSSKEGMNGWNQSNADDLLLFFTLGDLWDAFREYRAYDTTVTLVLNGCRDGIVQYYVPYLSAIQLYGGFRSPIGPSTMRLLVKNDKPEEQMVCLVHFFSDAVGKLVLLDNNTLIEVWKKGKWAMLCLWYVIFSELLGCFRRWRSRRDAADRLLDSVPDVHYHQLPGHQECCVVCMEEYQKNERYAGLIRQGNATCPLCRATLAVVPPPPQHLCINNVITTPRQQLFVNSFYLPN